MSHIGPAVRPNDVMWHKLHILTHDIGW